MRSSVGRSVPAAISAETRAKLDHMRQQLAVIRERTQELRSNQESQLLRCTRLESLVP